MIALEAEVRVALGLTPTITDAETARLMLAVQAGHSSVRKLLKYDPEQKLGPAEFYPRADAFVTQEDMIWDKVGGKAQMLTESRLFRYLQLQRLPLRQITELRVDYSAQFGVSGDFGGGTAWTEGLEYAVEWSSPHYSPTGCLVANGGWPGTLGTIKATYRAGFSPSEFNGPVDASSDDDNGYITTAGVDASPIKAACLLECMRAYHTTASFSQSLLTGLLIPGPKQSESLGSYSYSLASGAAAALLTSMAAAISPQAAGLLDPFVNYGQLVGKELL